MNMHHIMAKIERIGGDHKHEDALENILDIDREIMALVKQQKMRDSVKWYVMVAIGVLVSVILYYSIAGINYLFFSTQEAEVLRDALIREDFIKKDLSI